MFIFVTHFAVHMTVLGDLQAYAHLCVSVTLKAYKVNQIASC